MVIWLIGLSGAGKTTIGREVVRLWRQTAPNTVLIDGDEVRALFRSEIGSDAYTMADRRANAERITGLCAWLDGQGMNVVCCILSIFPELRAQNRQRFSEYFEVYVSVPQETLVARDFKDIYKPALAGRRENVVGVDIPFPEPRDADLTIDNSVDGADVTRQAETVLKAAGRI